MLRIPSTSLRIGYLRQWSADFTVYGELRCTRPGHETAVVVIAHGVASYLVEDAEAKRTRTSFGAQKVILGGPGASAGDS